jgi:uncharacterized protein YndB with AHSA1/START domain
MTAIVSEVDIARPPDQVFSYVTDPSRFGEWQSDVVSGHLEGDGPPHVGSKCTMTRRINGSDRTSMSEISQFAPPRTWAIRGIDGPIRADVDIRVAPLDDGTGSHVSIHIDFRGYGVGKMLVPIVVRFARKEAPQTCQNLKQRLESGG